MCLVEFKTKTAKCNQKITWKAWEDLILNLCAIIAQRGIFSEERNLTNSHSLRVFPPTIGMNNQNYTSKDLKYKCWKPAFYCQIPKNANKQIHSSFANPSHCNFWYYTVLEQFFDFFWWLRDFAQKQLLNISEALVKFITFEKHTNKWHIWGRWRVGRASACSLKQ